MMKRKLFILGVSIIALAFSGPALADDESEVRAAILDYVHAFYDADMPRAERSIWDQLAKRGFARRAVNDDYTGPLIMSWDDLIDTVNNYSKDDPPGDDAIRRVTIFEITDQTASAKVEAVWGFDYMHLAKMEGKWMIVNVLWQTYPDLETPEASS